MKLSDFWFDLPSALCDISRDILSKEEIDNCNLINNTSQVNLYFLHRLLIISMKILLIIMRMLILN